MIDIIHKKISNAGNIVKLVMTINDMYKKCDIIHEAEIWYGIKF